MKVLSAVILLAALSISAVAQSEVAYGLDLGAAVTLNNPAGMQKANLHLGGWIQYNRVRVGYDGFYDSSKINPRRPSFGAASATYQLYDNDWFKAHLGAFAAKQGNEVVGGGEARLALNKLELVGRYGSKNFAYGDGVFWLLRVEHFAVGVGYVVTRLEGFQTVQQSGVRIRVQ